MELLNKIKKTTDSKRLEMLEREKELLKDINHKNIVRLEAHVVDNKVKWYR